MKQGQNTSQFSRYWIRILSMEAKLVGEGERVLFVVLVDFCISFDGDTRYINVQLSQAVFFSLFGR